MASRQEHTKWAIGQCIRALSSISEAENYNDITEREPQAKLSYAKSELDSAVANLRAIMGRK